MAPGRHEGMLCATAAIVLAALLGGCEAREQIARQTVAVKAQDTAAEIEAGQAAQELVAWRQVRSFEVGLSKPRAIAVGPDGSIYAGGEDAIRSFSPEGEVQWELPLDGEVRALEVADDGTMFVGFMESVAVLDPSGREQLRITPQDRRTWITSLAVSDDAIFVADAGARKVRRFDRQGNPTGEIGSEDPERGIPSLATPSPHLDVALSGNVLLIANPGRHSVQRHSVAGGALLGRWGDYGPDVEGFSGCCNPTDLAVLPDGRVVTGEKGNPRVKIYSPDGELLSVVAPPSEFREDTTAIDLQTDASGRVVALDPPRGEIHIYEEIEGSEEETG
ncbi:MAG: hypothetical protein ACP5KN_13550 [Armatimonadota bacterium]